MRYSRTKLGHSKLGHVTAGNNTSNGPRTVLMESVNCVKT